MPSDQLQRRLNVLPSGLPEYVADAEPLSRFLTSDSHFNSVMAKPSAFMPRNDSAETSVFRQGPDSLPALWETADGALVGRNVRAVAILTGADVRQARLNVKADEPPLKHANIVGWPSGQEDVELMRAQRKERALLMAQAARLIKR